MLRGSSCTVRGMVIDSSRWPSNGLNSRTRALRWKEGLQESESSGLCDRAVDWERPSSGTSVTSRMKSNMTFLGPLTAQEKEDEQSRRVHGKGSDHFLSFPTRFFPN